VCVLSLLFRIPGTKEVEGRGNPACGKRRQITYLAFTSTFSAGMPEKPQVFDK